MLEYKRNQLLKLDDAALGALCTFEFYKGKGPGGQKRNKTSSAVRVRLCCTDFVAEDCTERSQYQNKSKALRKLKNAIALAWRDEPPPSLSVPFTTSTKNSLYPLLLAELADIIYAYNFDHFKVAILLGVTPSAIIKKIKDYPDFWTWFRKGRIDAGLCILK